MRAREVPLPEFSVIVGFALGETVVTVWGELDLATAPCLRQVLDGLAHGARDVAGRARRQVVVDLFEVTFLDSSGLRVLADAAERVRPHADRIVLRRPNPIVLKVLDFTGLLTAFDMDAGHGVRPARAEAHRSRQVA